jgi:hypothetical protein
LILPQRYDIFVAKQDLKDNFFKAKIRRIEPNLGDFGLAYLAYLSRQICQCGKFQQLTILDYFCIVKLHPGVLTVQFLIRHRAIASGKQKMANE